MKGDILKKLIVIGLMVVIGILVYQKEEEIIIPSNAIRIRIIANSNSVSDLYQKKMLKESIKNDLYDYVKEAKTSEEANNNINNNLDNIKKIISKKTTDYKLDYGINYFPKKTYKGVVYPEGDYQSLVITLGSGLGDNWWCVLYPPLCLIDENNTTSNVEYRTLISELLKIDNNG